MGALCTLNEVIFRGGDGRIPPQAEIAAQENSMLKTLLKCLTPCREGMKKQPALACLAFMKNNLASAPAATQTAPISSQGTSASSIVPHPMIPTGSAQTPTHNDSSTPKPLPTGKPALTFYMKPCLSPCWPAYRQRIHWWHTAMRCLLNGSLAVDSADIQAEGPNALLSGGTNSICACLSDVSQTHEQH